MRRVFAVRRYPAADQVLESSMQMLTRIELGAVAGQVEHLDRLARARAPKSGNDALSLIQAVHGAGYNARFTAASPATAGVL